MFFVATGLNGSPLQLQLQGLRFQAKGPPLLEWGRVYVEEVRVQEEEEEKEPAGSERPFFVLLFVRDPDTWGQRRLNGFRLKDLPRTRTHADADESAR